MVTVIIISLLVIVILYVLLNRRKDNGINREEIIRPQIMVSINGGEYKEIKNSPQERANREKRQLLMKKKDERMMRKHKIWLVLRYMISHRQLVQSSTFYDFKKYIADHKYAIGELRKSHPNKYSFDAAIRFCRMEYYYGTCDHQLTEADIEFILNWQSNIINTHDILKNVFVSYKEYWDGVLSSYIRPSARTKRLRYLIENLEEMMDLSDIQEYPDILQGMKELQNQYQVQLNENPQ